MRTHGLCLLLLGVLPSALAVDFQREIRPILSDNCFFCHGPDEKTRLMGLRLDTREGAFARRPSGSVLVPGKPSDSLLYQRISARDGKVMPPAQSHKTLTEAQKTLIRKWIEGGAQWSEHWAYTAPKKAPAPPVRNAKWPRNAIDRFVLARLEAEGLEPAPEADRRTLARRVSLDLTGLPPKPEDAEAFANDKRPDAYERYVDALLDSKQWGEHRGRYWLDAARYADTHGIHIDNYREMWPYRDWVIQAFNRNLPFDRFVVEQIAGDLLPDRTPDQQIATGFHRCNVTTNEGGVIPEEIDAMYAKDRVDTTGTVFLGLTVGCATCHDHKFDPIRQRDFYAMAAFFRNTVQKPLDGNIPDTPPVLVVPRQEDEARWKQLPEEEASLRARKNESRQGAAGDFAKWLGGESRRRVSEPVEPADELLSLTVAGGKPILNVKGRPADLTLPEGVTLGEAHIPGRQALHFNGKPVIELPPLENIEAGKPLAVSVWFRMPRGEDNFVLAAQTDAKSRGRGWIVDITARMPFLRLTGQGGRTLVLRGSNVERLKPGEWYHLALSYDGNRDSSGMSLFVNGKPATSEGRGESSSELRGEIRNFAPLRIGSDTRRHFDGGAIADLRVYQRDLSEDDARVLYRWPELDLARATKAADLAPEVRAGFEDYYLTRESGEFIDLNLQAAALRRERIAIARRGAITHVQQERTDSEPTAHVLYRGQYDQPRDKVTAATPSVLPPMSSSMPRNRLGLAEWIVDPANPLTARVAVNRFWQEVFGTGLVKTADDFGSQGEPPSHPELLDWLAVEFRQQEWDVKKLFRLLVTSSAYRQSAATTPLKIEKDAQNRLLSRGPRFRMDAEMIRDYSLAASGLLRPTIGGPSVKPYQPDGVWEAVAMAGSNTRFYKRDAGDKLYRRSLYSFWKRSAPPAAMEIFNAPTRENCTVRRERTNTPLQALATMNDVQHVEAARVLAEAALKQAPGDLGKQLDWMTARLLSRGFDPAEREVVRKTYADLLRLYDSRPEEARKLISQGESKPDASLLPPALAALTMLANELLNLDEVLTK